MIRTDGAEDNRRREARRTGPIPEAPAAPEARAAHHADRACRGRPSSTTYPTPSATAGEYLPPSAAARGDRTDTRRRFARDDVRPEALDPMEPTAPGSPRDWTRRW